MHPARHARQIWPDAAQCTQPDSTPWARANCSGVKGRTGPPVLPPRSGHGHAVLQVSAGFHYRWDARRPAGQRVLPGSVTLDGVPLDPARSYKVVVNNFLAEGGDGFPQLGQGTDKVDTGIRDLDAFTDYLVKRARTGKPAGAAAELGVRVERVQ